MSISDQLDAARDRLKSETPGPGYLTVDEAAELARCAPKTIRRAFTSGALRAFRPAHRVLLREDDVRAWVESQAATRSELPRPGRSRPRRVAPGSVADLRERERELSR